MKTVKILAPGVLTTVQDSGRWGYQQFGMSVAGAMDQYSFRIANILVGNDEGEATIETTFFGLELEFTADDVISITGGDLGPQINGKPAPMWESIKVKSGDKLKFTGPKSGIRAYIAFASTIDVPVIMGSKSTFLKGNLGGFEGKSLVKGDELPLGDKKAPEEKYVLGKEYIPEYKKNEKIRVVLGPQDDYFTEEGIKTFFSSEYKITNEADRMGYRLDGPIIEHKDGADIISDGIVFGSVQIPGQGKPIIMMADRQTTGGYTKIGTIITEDLAKIAQMGPGNVVSFEEISIDEAEDLYIKYENKIGDLRDNPEKLIYKADESKVRSFKVVVGDVSYDVTLEEL